MICIDTTVLIDEFRAAGDLSAPVNQALLAHSSEDLIVPVIAAGEFLDGAAMVSDQRFMQGLAVLRRRKVVHLDLGTAEHYGRIVSALRQQKKLKGCSPNDLWIAACARHHGARLMTRNLKHFESVSGLEVVGY